MLDRGDAIDLDIERPWMRGDIHEHGCGRILRKEFCIDAVDGGEHLHRCAIDGALQNVVEDGRAELLGTLTMRNLVPAIFETREFVAGGGLASYGGNIID